MFTKTNAHRLFTTPVFLAGLTAGLFACSTPDDAEDGQDDFSEPGDDEGGSGGPEGGSGAAGTGGGGGGAGFGAGGGSAGGTAGGGTGGSEIGAGGMAGIGLGGSGGVPNIGGTGGSTGGAAGGTAGTGGTGGGPPGSKLNVLFVVFDDLNRRISPYGDPIAKTPHLAKFAERAVLFRRAYAQYPVCGPSRISFLSGLRPEQTKVLGNREDPREVLPNHVYLPQHFKNQGYFSARVGKVYEIGKDDPKSWNVSLEGTPGSGVVYQNEEPQKLKLTVLQSRNHGDLIPVGENGQTHVLSDPDEKTADGLIAKAGVGLIDTATKGSKPFFIAVGFRRPHLPWAAPKKYFDMYPLESLPNPPSTYGAWTRGNPNQVMPPTRYKQSLQAYYAALSFADAQFGKLLAAMDAKDLWKNTIVVVMGDHGYHLGTRKWWGKNTPFDEANAAPLLIAAPGVASGATKEVVEFVDIYPTLVDLAGLPPKTGLSGRSLVNVLKAPGTHSGGTAVSLLTTVPNSDVVYTRAWNAMGMRLIEFLETSGRRLELYDVESDPDELTNLATSPSHQAVRNQMDAALQAHKAKFPN